MKASSGWLVFQLALLLSAGSSLTMSAQEKVPIPQSAVFVVVDKTPAGVRYRVDSRDVTKDPLRGISIAFEERGGAKTDVPVVALVDDRLPISILADVAGLIGKVGFTRPRYFRYRRGTGQIGEVSFGRFYATPQDLDLDAK